MLDLQSTNTKILNPYLDRREGGELQRSDGAEEDLDNFKITSAEFRRRNSGFRLELEAIEELEVLYLEEGERERHEREDDEEEENVVRVEQPIRHPARVPEPERFGRRQSSSQRSLGFSLASVRQHSLTTLYLCLDVRGEDGRGSEMNRRKRKRRAGRRERSRGSWRSPIKNQGSEGI